MFRRPSPGASSSSQPSPLPTAAADNAGGVGGGGNTAAEVCAAAAAAEVCAVAAAAEVCAVAAAAEVCAAAAGRLNPLRLAFLGVAAVNDADDFADDGDAAVADVTAACNGAAAGFAAADTAMESSLVSATS